MQRRAMKAQLGEITDAAMDVGLRQNEFADALRRGEDYLRLAIDTIVLLRIPP